MRNLTDKQLHLLDLLIALNDWESMQKGELKTQSGRSLYYQLARVLLDERKNRSALKQRLGRLSERSIRDRMRAFEANQLLQREPGVFDARTRTLVPTERFLDIIEQHLAYCQKTIESRYFLIEKN